VSGCNLGLCQPPVPITIKQHIPCAAGGYCARSQGIHLSNAAGRPSRSSCSLTFVAASRLARLGGQRGRSVDRKAGVFAQERHRDPGSRRACQSETGESHLASPRIDRSRRPYEGTERARREAMQAYLDGMFGLVESSSGWTVTHGFCCHLINQHGAGSPTAPLLRHTS